MSNSVGPAHESSYCITSLTGRRICSRDEHESDEVRVAVLDGHHQRSSVPEVQHVHLEVAPRQQGACDVVPAEDEVGNRRCLRCWTDNFLEIYGHGIFKVDNSKAKSLF